ncbi:hypothetical protein [Leclercia adecarboxylata]|uniref:hypothetical protein n=1 Tax=Leclercia adecarboxylata TaxID=83655 RepID=UPI001F066A18|nr:hypothetical protein [Leclercia adecarboxylata]MCH2680413.1 hypothetical protein [Leclercia adecarboxylata]
MSDVAKILEVLAQQEEQRIQKESLLTQRQADQSQRRADLARLKDELTVALQNRGYNKNVMVEQLQRDPTLHGEAIAQLLTNTFEAIFVHLHPNVDKHIKTLQSKITSLENHQE